MSKFLQINILYSIGKSNLDQRKSYDIVGIEFKLESKSSFRHVLPAARQQKQQKRKKATLGICPPANSKTGNIKGAAWWKSYGYRKRKQLDRQEGESAPRNGVYYRTYL